MMLFARNQIQGSSSNSVLIRPTAALLATLHVTLSTQDILSCDGPKPKHVQRRWTVLMRQ